jgi:hypothetical protein
MQKNVMQNALKAGVVNKELAEIKKMQKSPDTYWSLLTNTCSGFYTIFCC